MKKRNGFFDITDDQDDESASEVSTFDGNEITNVTNGGENALERRSSKKQIYIIAAITIALFAIFWGLSRLGNSDIISDSPYYPESWLDPIGQTEKPVYTFCTPDWDSDILNDPEYLALKGDIFYAKNDSVMITVTPNQYLSEGGKELKFMGSYVEAVIKGDHDALNAMFTDKYFEKNEPYDDFPEQRLYNIKIKKYHYKDPYYENTLENDGYYIITYKIDKNDGLFRDDIGSDNELAQLFELIIYPDGTVKIDNIITLPGYNN